MIIVLAHLLFDPYHTHGARDGDYHRSEQIKTCSTIN